MSEPRDDELAALVRSRLEALQPRQLPEHFVPPALRSHPTRRIVAAAAVAIVLGLAATAALRPDLGSLVLSGLLGRHPATPSPAPSASSLGLQPAPGGAVTAEPTVTPPGGTPAPPTPGTAPAPPPSAPAPPVPAALPSLPVTVPSLPLPTPGLPLPTPSLPLPSLAPPPLPHSPPGA